ncbi:MAG: hypothetical protein GY757_07670 [bacterium]|nr:hypothetical protein [bacterium]
MSNKEYYEQKLETLQAIPVPKIRIPNHIPIAVYIQEAENLYGWCREDSEELERVGLSREMVEDLPIRTGALVEAEARWNNIRVTGTEAAKEWAEASVAGHRLRKELLNQFKYAFRNTPDLFRALKAIRTGESHADMLQELNDLSVLGRGQTQLLSEINFDMALLDEAAEASDLFSEIHAKAASDRDLIDDCKVIRNQAYLHLKEAVDAIRSAGKFAFSTNNDRQKGYFSFHLQQKRARRTKKEEPTPSATPLDSEASSPGTNK